MSKKIIAVTGATGAQGGGLVRAILADKNGEYTPRAITRKPDGEKARELAKQGVEVVVADLDDVASVTKAFAGAHGAFCVTNFWEHFSPERELAQAKALADAAKSAGVAHAIWSTLEDTRKRVPLTDSRMPTLKEKYKVPHFDAKGEGVHFMLPGMDSMPPDSTSGPRRGRAAATTWELRGVEITVTKIVETGLKLPGRTRLRAGRLRHVPHGGSAT